MKLQINESQQFNWLGERLGNKFGEKHLNGTLNGGLSGTIKELKEKDLIEYRGSKKLVGISSNL